MPRKQPESDNEIWNNVADIWTDYQESGYDFLRKHAFHRLKETLQKGKFEQILDLGCGPGIFTNQLTAYCPSVSGIDCSSRMIEIAKQKFDMKRGIHFFVDDATKLESAPANYFDFVVCMFSLQNISDAKAAFKQVYRACRRNGRVFLCLYYPGLFKEKYKPANLSRKRVTLDTKEIKLPIVWNLKGMEEPICTNAYFRPITQYFKLLMDLRFGVESAFCWDKKGKPQPLAGADDSRIVDLWLNK